MSLSILNPLLALAPQAQPGQQAAPAWTSFVPLVLLIVVFYFILIRPQQKKAKDHAELLKSIRRGDEVVTSGGMIGEVVNVKDKSVVVRSLDAKFEVSKSAIAEILKRSGEPNANES